MWDLSGPAREDPEPSPFSVQGAAGATAVAPALRASGPPMPILYGAAGASALALVLLAINRSIGSAAAAWLLAGPIAIGLYGLFLTRDTTSRARAGYGYPSWLGLATVATLALAGIGIIASAWFVALWAGLR